MGSKVRSWFEKMQRLGEADIPALSVAGRMLTPREVLQHAEANDKIWQMIKKQYPDLDPQEFPEELLKERIKRKYEAGKLLPVYFMGRPHILTPEQQLKEIEAGTEIGKKLLEAEKKLLQELMR